MSEALQHKRFESFRAFYPYYLQEHKNRTCRRLHVVGSLLVLATLATSLLTANYALLWLLPVLGYGFAWVGHFFFEKNKPATFKYPFYSLMGDWVMLKDVLTGKLRW
ncbi:DUF962 domain-containing protein [Lacimicrobium sp. SS2-24]|uniref:DUF962 domain-containing protein n=1 Tax=Lacimicrobium sp. SS2-24 TaxID=2005569 RepID=UPI000B4B81DD|nr:DUF962 domain-containing protein [Lacimicrobium sp. SS2-24]